MSLGDERIDTSLAELRESIAVVGARYGGISKVPFGVRCFACWGEIDVDTLAPEILVDFSIATNRVWLCPDQDLCLYRKAVRA